MKLLISLLRTATLLSAATAASAHVVWYMVMSYAGPRFVPHSLAA